MAWAAQCVGARPSCVWLVRSAAKPPQVGGGGEGEGGVGVGVSGATLKFLFELVGRMVSALWTG